MTTTQAGIAGNVTDEMVSKAREELLDWDFIVPLDTIKRALSAALASQPAQPVTRPLWETDAENAEAGARAIAAILDGPAPSQEPVAVVKASEEFRAAVKFTPAKEEK